MPGNEERAGERWLSLAHQDEEAIDRAMRGLFTALPRELPPPGLSARIADATRLAWPSRVPVPTGGRARTDVAVTAGVLGGAAALTLMPAAVLIALLFFDAGALVTWLAHASVWAIEWMRAGVSVWNVLGNAGRVLQHVAESPAGTAVLLGGVLTASLALVGLNRLMPDERSE
jgi:hypothetical protein